MSNSKNGFWSKIPKVNPDRTPLQEYVVIDTETTGLFKNDRVIEIGIIAFNEQEILEEWSTLLNPNRDIGPTQIHGITPTMVSLAPEFSQISNDLARLLNNRVLIAHNASFDVRMLCAEFARIGVEFDPGNSFCTMIAARHNLPTGTDKLTDACTYLGIEVSNAHSALGDARMTLELFKFVGQDDQEVSPARLIYSPDLNPNPTLQRKTFTRIEDDSISRIRAFTKKVPFPTSDQSEVAYLLLLNMAMDDLIISINERQELIEWASKLNITDARQKELHKQYLDNFIQAALRDGVITSIEREMIDKIALAFNLEATIPELPTRIQTSEFSLEAGKKICFTGAAVTATNKPISRTELEALASKVGLFPVNSVTKKGCDILVAADEASMSGKTQKAREWGITVISVEKFITLCTFG